MYTGGYGNKSSVQLITNMKESFTERKRGKNSDWTRTEAAFFKNKVDYKKCKDERFSFFQFFPQFLKSSSQDQFPRTIRHCYIYGYLAYVL